MRSIFSIARSPNPADAAHLRGNWGWVVALGGIYLLAGAFALGSVVLATAASVFVVGMMMLASGIVEMIGAFRIKSWSSFALWVVLGALYAVAGFLTLDNPLFAAAALTLALGVALMVSGAARVVLALQMPRGSAWGMVILSGGITLFLGIVILAHWPVSSVYSLGIFLGTDLVFAGAGW